MLTLMQCSANSKLFYQTQGIFNAVVLTLSAVVLTPCCKANNIRTSCNVFGMIEISYDKEADAMYIALRKGTFSKNKVINDFMVLDLDKKGQVLGIELLDASKQVSGKTISSIKLKHLRAVSE